VERGLCAVTIEGGRVVAIERTDERPDGALGSPDSLVVPGLVDIQLNGAFGNDFSDPEADLAEVCAGLPRHGVTGFLATVVSSAPEAYPRCLTNVRATGTMRGARLLGVHLEGPFLNPVRAGAHERAALRPPDVHEVDAWLATGAVRLVTLAPELPGADSLIRMLVEHGVVVAAGHSDATWRQAEAGVRAGVELGTHLFNAMRPFHHRDPGLPGLLLAESVAVSVIADGAHLAPETLRLVRAAKGSDEIVLVTDGMGALGMPPGSYRLGPREVISNGIVARLSDGTIAGSVTPLHAAVRNLVLAGFEPARAVRAATLNPARLMGVDREVGRVAVERQADLVLLDEGWNVMATFVAGERVFAAPHLAAG
jgi:N-acetylglucosamine-6-phosphate deacetylase